MPHITQIELRGFKSFGNSKVTIPLSKGLTAFVGPNGIGKSNIVDGLCFVLGEISAKAMRAERLSGLLFKGGNGHRPAPFAEVSLHFNNEDGKLPTNSQTVVISRRVDRSGKCTYRINKKRASRQEIVDLLAASMASTGGYNFVMQGDVNRFVNLGSLERRLIIDDLAGVAEYDEKKQKSMAELQKVEMNLKSVGAVLRTISDQMEGLRAQMEAAIRYKQLRRELEQTQEALLLIQQETYAKKLSLLKQRIDKLGKKIKMSRDKHQAIIDEVTRYEEKIKELGDLIDEKRSADILLEAERARTQIETLSELLKTTSAQQSDIEAEIATVVEQIKKMGGEDSKAPSDKITSLSSKFEILREKFNALSKSLDENRSLTVVQSTIQKLRGVLDELLLVIDEISKCIGWLSRLHSEPRQESSVVELHDKLIGLKSTRAHLDAQLGDLKKKIQEAQSKLESASASEKEIRSSIEALFGEREKLRDKARGLDKRARDLDAKIRALEEKLQNWRVQEASLNTELKNVKDKCKKIKMKVSVPADINPDALERRAKTLEAEIMSLGDINLRAIRDFKESERQYNTEKLKYDKLIAEKQSLLDFMQNIDEKKKDIFMKAFNEISRHFSEIYSELSPTGTAELVLENEVAPFEGGLEIKARPEGTEVPYVGELSGGQKALTALAFIFALQRYQPTTFYVMDEIDAHLDPQNRKRVAEMLRRFSRESQILVITLHDAIMSVADRLFGVAKENGVSRLFSVELSGIGS
ncbi:MAG: chromosome segregation SMC family protein [Candidatus Hodarchaeaceae archaeon]|nr:chromosome segregation SMC family protein [Candidatus Hodarchaeaceae archaeon]